MNKYDLDFDTLSTRMSPKRMHKLADVAGKVRKVAFDVVRFTDTDNLDKLWRVETVNDEEYIVAMYDEVDDSVKVAKTASVNNPWRAVSNTSSVDIFYKGANVGTITPADATEEDLSLMAEWIPAKLAEDKAFVKSYIGSLSTMEAEYLNSIAPELTSGKN
jgi:hypothetical protein